MRAQDIERKKLQTSAPGHARCLSTLGTLDKITTIYCRPLSQFDTQKIYHVHPLRRKFGIRFRVNRVFVDYFSEKGYGLGSPTLDLFKRWVLVTSISFPGMGGTDCGSISPSTSDASRGGLRKSYSPQMEDPLLEWGTKKKAVGTWDPRRKRDLAEVKRSMEPNMLELSWWWQGKGWQTVRIYLFRIIY